MHPGCCMPSGHEDRSARATVRRQSDRARREYGAIAVEPRPARGFSRAPCRGEGESAGKGGQAARAHMRYIQRDGVTREGLPGEFYGPETDRADGGDFLKRTAGDRHQFCFIVSAEGGVEYSDLKP